MHERARNLTLVALLVGLPLGVLFLARAPERAGERAAPSPESSPHEAPRESAALVPEAAERAPQRQADLANGSAQALGSPSLFTSDEAGPAAKRVALEVAGRVLDRDDRPIEGAELLASTGRVEWRDRQSVARSDAQGRLRGTLGLDGSAVVFTVLAPHFQGERREVRGTAGGALELGTFRLAPGSEVSGTVLDLAGNPIPSAIVSSHPPEAFPDDEAAAVGGLGYVGSPADEDFSAAEESDAEGRFLLRGLPLGECFLAAHASGWSDGWTQVFDLGLAGKSDLPILLPPLPATAREITGSVRGPDGRLLSGIHILLHLGEGRLPLAETDARGRFVTNGHWNGPMDLLAFDPARRFATAEVRGVAMGTRDLEIVLSAAEWITVRMLDARAQSIPWGHVDSEDGGLQDAGRDGVVRLVRPERSFTLEGSAPGFRTRTFGPFEPDALGDELALTLEPGQAVRGRVLSKGRPVAGARLDLDPTPAPGITFEAMDVAPLDDPFLVTGMVDLDGNDGTSDADGTFLLTLHEDGWHSLSVQAPGLPLQVFGPYEFTREAGFEGLELELERAGRLTGGVLVPSEGSSTERLVAVSNGWNFAHTAPIGADGTYRIDGLAPGHYQVRPCEPPMAALQRLRAGGQTEEPPTWNCRVVADETTRFDLDLSQAGLLAGELVLSGAAPREWEVSLFPVTSGEWRAARAALTDGRFELPFSRPGHYRLELQSQPMFLVQDLELFAGRNEWSYRRTTGRVRLRASRALEPDWGTVLRFMTASEGPPFLEASLSPCQLDPRTGGELAFDAPIGPARLELTSEPQLGPDARWSPLRELVIRAGEELVVEYP